MRRTCCCARSARVIETPRSSVADRKADHFIDEDQHGGVGLDQLLMIRLAQQLGAAPDKLTGKEKAREYPISAPSPKMRRKTFRGIYGVLPASYARGLPRHAFVDLLESCIAVGMTTVLTSTIEILVRLG